MISAVLFLAWPLGRAMSALAARPGVLDHTALRDVALALAAIVASCAAIAYGAIGARALARRAAATRQQTDLAEQRRLGERLAAAIEHLASDNPSVRIGAAFELEKLAIDSPRDHWSIMEMLCAHVRRITPLDPLGRRLPAIEGRKPPQDAQIALSVVGRRRTENDPPDAALDLGGVDLVGADLRGGQFKRANFLGSDLSSANLSGGHFSYADFGSSIMRGVVAHDAHMQNADFSGADLTGARLDHAHLGGATLSEASIIHVIARRAIFAGAKLTEARISGSVFSGAAFARSSFKGATLDSSDFLGCSMHAADFTDASIARSVELESVVTLDNPIDAPQAS